VRKIAAKNLKGKTWETVGQTVQRELMNLVGLGIVKKRETNARVYYHINATSPFFKPLKEICVLAQEERISRSE
jgi:hypothetical protein